jgi:hypothetical protein
MAAPMWSASAELISDPGVLCWRVTPLPTRLCPV